MVGYRNLRGFLIGAKNILSGIPMVGYRNPVPVINVIAVILSGIPMVGYRNYRVTIFTTAKPN